MSITPRFFSKKTRPVLLPSQRTATSHLARWIANCKPLQTALAATHYDPRAKYLSPRQVKLIIEYLGEP